MIRRFVTPAGWRYRPSPNHGPRPVGPRGAVTALVLHADASDSVDATLDWCQTRRSSVSYHVLVGRTGIVFLLVAPERRAWHAGVSALDGVGDCNDFTVGVCLANRNDGVEPYPEAQLSSAAAVCRALTAHFDLPPERVVRHRDVARPAGRKTDPRPETFDVAAFRARLAPVDVQDAA